MSENNRFYITTAISYPNGHPHIGHAYELIATDALARFQRHDGKDVYFLTGTDEHGQKMVQTAEKEGMTARELADRNAAVFEQMAELLNASNDDFIRTSEERHHEACRALWEKMVAAGDIYKDTYAGWYSVRDEAYYQESETEVDDGGVRRGPAPNHTPVEWVEEESYFFRLSAYQDRLLEHYEKHPDYIGPDARRNEVVSFVKSGLKDLSMSRTTFDWGIKVPGDDKHVMYVWVDALTNYITAVGYPDADAKLWNFWPANIHVIGKDIIRFHAVYWPAFLMSAGVALPRRVYAHGFLFNRGEKMSKSIGNVVDPFAMVEHYGLDQVRYFFLREVPFGQDGNYSHEAIVGRINSDLANDLGNLAQRSLSMIAKNCDGKLPQPGVFQEPDLAMLAATDALLDKTREAMDKQAIHSALAAIFAVVSEANRYFAGQEPWALKKTDPERMGTVLYVTAEVIR
ncbi:MAG: methionine--tRNA ligase, partial [Pseudomonadota bacterium]